MSDSMPEPSGPPVLTMDQLEIDYAREVDDYKRYRSAWFGAGVLAALTVFVVAFMPVPYVKLSPGPMFNTVGTSGGIELIKITGAKTYPTQGELNLTTVNERGGPYGEITLPEAFTGWISDSDVVLPTTDLFPAGTTKQDAQQENQVEFSTSQSAAISAALTYLKIPVTSQVQVGQVAPEGPANAKIKVGDIITAFNGTKVSKPDELPPLVKAQKPGTTATLNVLRGKTPTTVEVTLGASPRDASQGYLGILGSALYAGPFPIEFGLQDVGGPSAGTMFALGIIDKLTPENLSDDKIVAGTGTISPTGEVGAIGGIQQKMYAAQNGGAQLFLAPRTNCNTVRSSAPEGLNVAAVSTLAEAVDVLAKWRTGSSDLPRC